MDSRSPGPRHDCSSLNVTTTHIDGWAGIYTHPRTQAHRSCSSYKEESYLQSQPWGCLSCAVRKPDAVSDAGREPLRSASLQCKKEKSPPARGGCSDRARGQQAGWRGAVTLNVYECVDEYVCARAWDCACGQTAQSDRIAAGVVGYPVIPHCSVVSNSSYRLPASQPRLPTALCNRHARARTHTSARATSLQVTSSTRARVASYSSKH